jgi:O-antigen ligase
VLRLLVVGALVLAPLLFGAVHPFAYRPLLGIAFLAGAWSWARGHFRRSQGEWVPELPGHGPLWALLGLVLLQLLPLPPELLRLVSPGSYAAYHIPPLPVRPWRPISVCPSDTLRGLFFLAGMGLLYATVFREFQQRRWRRRLCVALLGTGLALAVAALVQAASAHPTRIYGFLHVSTDWAVFGPYINRNHLAGYLAMVLPLGFGFVAESLEEVLARRRGRRLWRAVLDPAANAVAWRSAITIVLLVALLAAQSRGAIAACLASVPVFLALFRYRRAALVVVVLLLLLGLTTVDLGAMLQSFESRGFNRYDAWVDMLALVRYFPVFGAGLNAFGWAFRPYQTIDRRNLWGQAHNDYLQILLELGVVGLIPVALLLRRLLQAAVAQVRRDAVTAGIWAGIAASCVHALVDFDWRIPANGAALAALCGLAVAPPRSHPPAGRSHR